MIGRPAPLLGFVLGRLAQVEGVWVPVIGQNHIIVVAEGGLAIFMTSSSSSYGTAECHSRTNARPQPKTRPARPKRP
jgi:hypothetical protein